MTTQAMELLNVSEMSADVMVNLDSLESLGKMKRASADNGGDGLPDSVCEGGIAIPDTTATRTGIGEICGEMRGASAVDGRAGVAGIVYKGGTAFAGTTAILTKLCVPFRYATGLAVAVAAFEITHINETFYCTSGDQVVREAQYKMKMATAGHGAVKLVDFAWIGATTFLGTRAVLTTFGVFTSLGLSNEFATAAAATLTVMNFGKFQKMPYLTSGDETSDDPVVPGSHGEIILPSAGHGADELASIAWRGGTTFLGTEAALTALGLSNEFATATAVALAVAEVMPDCIDWWKRIGPTFKTMPPSSPVIGYPDEQTKLYEKIISFPSGQPCNFTYKKEGYTFTKIACIPVNRDIPSPYPDFKEGGIGCSFVTIHLTPVEEGEWSCRVLIWGRPCTTGPSAEVSKQDIAGNDFSTSGLPLKQI